ncbi:hypothetical protein BJY04DRAFT_199426 [Aspergillus karnatakaensis]|uniref:uncharacterized protein n=1 Tax=Aspergillus karnatakaensis TaxID=1810916 RepID=UPI003CCE02FD
MPNPIEMPPRFEIRKLGPEHLEWAKAIMCHSNVFHSPVWSRVYPDNGTEIFYEMFDKITNMVKHQIDSGLSYGVFDKEYKFKHPEAAATGGANLWDPTRDPALSGEQILEKMDYPLASIALAFDAINPIGPEILGPLFGALPEFPIFFGYLTGQDTRDPAVWTPKGPMELLNRMGTSTREDYTHLGITKKMAQWLMWDAAEKGFRAINIECFHDAVHHIWTNPPAPFRAELVAIVRADEYEAEEDGKTVRPYAHVTQALSKVNVHLK